MSFKFNSRPSLKIFKEGKRPKKKLKKEEKAPQAKIKEKFRLVPLIKGKLQNTKIILELIIIRNEF